MYSQALESTDYEYQTLADYKWVAENAEFSFRNENLSFAHHRQLASLEPEDQKIWLDKAVEHNLIVISFLDS